MIIKDNSSPGSTLLVPGVGSSYGNGFNKLTKYFPYLFLIVLIAFLFGLPTTILTVYEYLDISLDLSVLWSIFSFIWGLLVTTPLEYGVSYAYLKAARDEKPEIKDVLKVLENYWNSIIASILSAIIIIIGLILIVVPGIYFACKLAFVRYLVVEEKMPALAAIDESWRMTRGHAMTIFTMGLLAIPVFIGGLLLFGIGVIFSGMWVEAAFASLYYAVSLEKKTITAKIEKPEQGPFI
jgi:hypothetical protein